MTLSDPVLLLEQHLASSKSILLESCDGLTLDQRYIVEGIYQEFVPLIEATLTADQIKQIFGQVEKAAISGGTSRTALGKGIDVTKKANEILNKAGRWIQDTRPVKAFDQKFEDLKNKINTKFPDSKILDAVSYLGMFAKNNPGKTAVVIGILTAVAALAAGPVAGAIAGQVLRGSTELLKGEKLSTAIGKGAKSAAIGALAGMTFNYLSDAAADLITTSKEWDVANQWKALDQAAKESALEGGRSEYGDFVDVLDGAMNIQLNGNINGFRFNYDVILTADQFEKYQEFESQLQGIDTYSDEWVKVTTKFHEFMLSVQNSPDQATLRATSNAIKELENVRASYDDVEASGIFTKIDNIEEFKAAAAEFNPKIAAAVQAGAQEATALANKAQKVTGKPAESVYVQQRPLSEGQVYMVFNRIDEASFIKRGAEWLGKQATEKVTASKLSRKWKAAGAPTDSEELANFLKSQGIDPAVIDQVYSSLSLPTSSNTQAAQSTTSGLGGATLYAQVKADVEKLNKKDKQRIAAYLQKSLGTN